MCINIYIYTMLFRDGKAQLTFFLQETILRVDYPYRFPQAWRTQFTIKIVWTVKAVGIGWEKDR